MTQQQVLPFAAGAATAPMPTRTTRRMVGLGPGWLARRRAAAREQRKTVALLRVTAGDLRAPGDRDGVPKDMPSPRQQRALLSAATFFLRAQASQLDAIGRSGVVDELVHVLAALAVASEPSATEGSVGPDGGSLRVAKRQLRAPKQLALGLSAIANLLFIGGFALADRARAGPLLIDLLQFNAHVEVQSYALAGLQNLSASAAHAGALVGHPGLLDALHDLAVTLPDGDQRFYYAAGAYANLCKLGVTHALRHREAKRAWWRGPRPADDVSVSAIKAGLHAADQAVESILRRREAIRLVQQATVTQRRWRARQERARFVRARAASRLIQAAVRRRRTRRDRLRAAAAASEPPLPSTTAAAAGGGGGEPRLGAEAGRRGSAGAPHGSWAHGRASRAPFSRASSDIQFHDIFAAT